MQLKLSTLRVRHCSLTRSRRIKRNVENTIPVRHQSSEVPLEEKGSVHFQKQQSFACHFCLVWAAFQTTFWWTENKWLRAQGSSADWFEEADTSCTWYCSFSCPGSTIPDYKINFARYGLHKPQRWWKRFYWHSLKLQISKYRLNELWCWICKRPCWYWFKLCFPSFWISTTLAASY